MPLWLRSRAPSSRQSATCCHAKLRLFQLHKSTRQQRTRTRRVSTPQEVEADRSSALQQHFVRWWWWRKGLAFLRFSRFFSASSRTQKRSGGSSTNCLLLVSAQLPFAGKIQVGRVLTQREQDPAGCHFSAGERSVRRHPEPQASGQSGAESSQGMSFLTVLGKNKQQGFPFPQIVKERGVGSSSGGVIRSCEAHGRPLLAGFVIWFSLLEGDKIKTEGLIYIFFIIKKLYFRRVFVVCRCFQLFLQQIHKKTNQQAPAVT